jgi:hypothetical protein
MESSSGVNQVNSDRDRVTRVLRNSMLTRRVQSKEDGMRSKSEEAALWRSSPRR